MSPKSLFDWSIELFPKAFAQAGELAWRRELLLYESEMPPSPVCADHFRYWPGFLRRKKFEFAATAGVEWAHYQVKKSPQDDQRGDGPLTILNATLEIVDDQAVWRVDGQLKSRTITWREAAVIDELRENPRLELQRLETELSAKTFPFKEATSFSNVLADLVEDGLLLRRLI